MTAKNKVSALSNHLAPIFILITLFIWLVLAVLTMMALWTYHPSDPAWSNKSSHVVQNALGVVGAWYSDLSFSLIGQLSYLVPLSLFILAVHAWFEKGLDKELLSWRLFMLLTAVLSGSVLWAKHDPHMINTVAQTGGGALGAWLVIGLEKSIKSVPVIMGFSLVIFVISISLLVNFPWLRLAGSLGKAIASVVGLLFSGFVSGREKEQRRQMMKQSTEVPQVAKNDEDLQKKINAINKMVADDKTERHRFTIDRYEPEATSVAETSDGQMTRLESQSTMITPDPIASGHLRGEVGFSQPEKEAVKPVDLTILGVSNRPRKAERIVEPAKPLLADISADSVNDGVTQITPPISAEPNKSEPDFFNFKDIKLSSIINKVEQTSEEPMRSLNSITATAQDKQEKSEKPINPSSKTTPITQVQTESEPVANPVVNTSNFSAQVSSIKASFDILPITPVAPASSSQPTKATIGKAYDVEQETPLIKAKQVSHVLPSIDLLEIPSAKENAYTEDALAEMATVLETTLKQFNLNATVMHVSPGPVITRFELELAPGIQAKKITNLSQDLARALAVSRVRVEEVIPGSSYVGLEVPNKTRQIVYFKDVICSKAFQDSQSPLTISLGSDTSGKPVVADLMKMPHALVAGTTGSGKSVCINVMLLSMLYKASPKDLRLILVDPKMLEMSMYEDIPHLLTPVITDMNEAENALTWAVSEMERRYQLMAALKVRKIDAFNEMVEAANDKGQPIEDPLWQPDEQVGYTHTPTLERFPFVVIVIDELADMMMVVGKQVEQLIARLTQKARAAGIHVVLATQRPSTDVLTGLIKANVPTRIAFQVSSGTDSRVIIDSVGAEKLLGHGDMLYVPPGASHPQRLHGAFVGDAETDRITDFLRSMGEPDYIESITSKQDPGNLGAFGAAEAAGAKEDADPLYEEAIQIVLQTGKASISSVQRQLRIGYNRAARMIEDMQEQGIVSEPVNGIRKVLAAPLPKDPI
ncbi:MAG: DNA translocase FtsK [Ostreibacterium sp.]